MRTTLDIDDDVLLAAKGLAKRWNITIGLAVSKLLRKALEPKISKKVRNGVPLLEPGSCPTLVTIDTVNRIRDEEGI